MSPFRKISSRLVCVETYIWKKKVRSIHDNGLENGYVSPDGNSSYSIHTGYDDMVWYPNSVLPLERVAFIAGKVYDVETDIRSTDENSGWIHSEDGNSWYVTFQDVDEIDPDEDHHFSRLNMITFEEYRDRKLSDLLNEGSLHK